MKFYKIVFLTNDKKYVSCVSYGKYSLEYSIEEWTKPKIGKIFVFNTFYNAKNFIAQENMLYSLGVNYFIFECDVINPQVAKYCGSVSEEGIVRYWHENSFITHVPYGTYFADEIKLVKNLYTVKEFVSREIAEEYINKDVNPNDDLIAEIHND